MQNRFAVHFGTLSIYIHIFPPPLNTPLCTGIPGSEPCPPPGIRPVYGYTGVGAALNTPLCTGIAGWEPGASPPPEYAPVYGYTGVGAPSPPLNTPLCTGTPGWEASYSDVKIDQPSP